MKRGDKFALLAEAHTGPQAVDLVAKLKPELLILEVELGGLSPASLLEKCRAAHPAIQFLLLSNGTAVKAVGRTAGTGVMGVIDKQDPTELLLQALRVIRSGETWFTQSTARRAGTAPPERHLSIELTAKEQQVLDHMLVGKNNGTIADHMQVTKQTIRRHASIIYEKLGVTTRVQAILRARVLRDESERRKL